MTRNANDTGEQESLRTKDKAAATESITALLEFGCPVSAIAGDQIGEQRSRFGKARDDNRSALTETRHGITAALLAPIMNCLVLQVDVLRVQRSDVRLRAPGDPNWASYVGDPFDMSLDPVKMPQMAAGALMFIRGDLESAKQTVERSYSHEQVMDSRFLPGTERPYFTPGFPLSVPLMHGTRIRSLNGEPTAAIADDRSSPYKSDTGQLVWRTDTNQTSLVTIDSPRSQGLIGFVKANRQHVSNLAADIKNDSCSIVVNSLESKPISSAGKLLLTACVRVENTGMQWDGERTRVTEQGRSPTLIEPVTGTIILRNLEHAKKVSVKALDGSGGPIGDPLIAKKSGVGWEITVGEPATTWYEVSVER